MTAEANSGDRGPKGGGGKPRGKPRGNSGGQGGQKRSGGGQGGGKRGGRRDEPDNPAEQLKKPLEKVLARLPETQRRVLEMRMGLTDGHPHDLADTARELGLSMGEARDIEKRAFEHIREAVPLQQLQRFLGH
jgi:hypothetical protein